MKPSENIKLGLIILTIPIFFGCGGDKLSRGKAEEIIKNSTKFPLTQSLVISNTYSTDANGTVLHEEREKDDGLETKEMFDFFANKNLMTIADKFEYFNGSFRFITGFTDEGKKYTINVQEAEPFATHTIKLCDNVFNEITGILINEQTKAATVEYSLKRTNWTPLGVYFKEKRSTKYPEIIVGQRATLQKYDDGWRIAGQAPY